MFDDVQCYDGSDLTSAFVAGGYMEFGEILPVE